MTFTFDATLSTDLAKVRFNIGDTDSSGYYLQDETIIALLSSESTVGGATVAALRYIVNQLSRPDFKADWLQVSNKEAANGMRSLLRDAIRRYGAGRVTAQTTDVYRADSSQTSEPDYSSGA